MWVVLYNCRKTVVVVVVVVVNFVKPYRGKWTLYIESVSFHIKTKIWYGLLACAQQLTASQLNLLKTEKKIRKRNENKNQYRWEDTVCVIVHGVSPEGGIAVVYFGDFCSVHELEIRILEKLWERVALHVVICLCLSPVRDVFCWVQMSRMTVIWLTWRCSCGIQAGCQMMNKLIVSSLWQGQQCCFPIFISVVCAT